MSRQIIKFEVIVVSDSEDDVVVEGGETKEEVYSDAETVLMDVDFECRSSSTSSESESEAEIEAESESEIEAVSEAENSEMEEIDVGGVEDNVGNNQRDDADQAALNDEMNWGLLNHIEMSMDHESVLAPFLFVESSENFQDEIRRQINRSRFILFEAMNLNALNHATNLECLVNSIFDRLVTRSTNLINMFVEKHFNGA